MKKTQQTLGEKMLLMSTVLQNVEDEVIRTSMERLGYNDSRFNEGLVLYNAVNELNVEQEAAKAAKSEATRLFNEAYDLAKSTFNDNVAIARRALKGNLGSIRELGITGRRPGIFEGWFKMARSFYTTALANASILGNFILFGVSQQTLEDGLFQLNSLEPLYAIQKDKMGLSQVATSTRDNKLAEMRIWYRDFISMARIAFRKDPQQLERFGIIKYSPGYSPKKKEIPTDTLPPVLTAKTGTWESQTNTPTIN